MLHDTNNEALEHEFNHLALNLRNMWYQHGYTGLRYFRQHMADIYNRFQHLLDEDKIDHETVRAAMGACDDLMALKTVPSESWAPYVAGIKRRLSQSESESEGGSEGGSGSGAGGEPSPSLSTISSSEESPLEGSSADADPAFVGAAAAGLIPTQGAQSTASNTRSNGTSPINAQVSQVHSRTPRRASS
ncbi:hypothetical protein IAU59_006592 [Kwoniella sp. CBS 9459]